MNLSLKSLADAVGMDKGGLSKLERGEQGYGQESIEKIAKVLCVSVGVLFAEPAVVEAAAFRMRRIPLLTTDELMGWKGADGVDVEETGEYLHGSLERMSRHVFALRVPSDTTWTPYRQFDDLIFDAKRNVRHGEIVAAQNAAGTVYVGRVRIVDAAAGFEIWPAGALDPVAISQSEAGLKIRGVLVEERRYTA